MKASQHHELMRLTSLGELTPSEYSELTGEKFNMKTESEEIQNKERPELIKLLSPVFKLIGLIGFIYLTKCVYAWAMAWYIGGIMAIESYKNLIVMLYIIFTGGNLLLFVFRALSGGFDPWIKKNIDPYIIKFKNWINRRNEP